MSCLCSPSCVCMPCFVRGLHSPAAGAAAAAAAGLTLWLGMPGCLLVALPHPMRHESALPLPCCRLAWLAALPLALRHPMRHESTLLLPCCRACSLSVSASCRTAVAGMRTSRPAAFQAPCLPRTTSGCVSTTPPFAWTIRVSGAVLPCLFGCCAVLKCWACFGQRVCSCSIQASAPLPGQNGVRSCQHELPSWCQAAISDAPPHPRACRHHLPVPLCRGLGAVPRPQHAGK